MGPEGWRRSNPQPVLPTIPLSQPISQIYIIISCVTLVLHVTQKTFVREFGEKILRDPTLEDLGIGFYVSSINSFSFRGNFVLIFIQCCRIYKSVQ